MLLQDVICDIIKKKGEEIIELQYENSATLRDLEVTLLINFAKTIELVRNADELKNEYLDRILTEIIKYNIELVDDEPYQLCVNYKNTEYVQRFFKLKMLI